MSDVTQPSDTELASSDLASRLEYHATGDSFEAMRRDHPFAVSIIQGYFIEAASRLREMGELERTVIRQGDRLGKFSGHVIDLEKALQPFADEAATYDTDDDEPDDLSYLIPSSLRLRIEEGDGTLTESIITVGDLRKAHAVLTKAAEARNSKTGGSDAR